MINTFNLARPPVPEMLVIARLPVSRVMERLRSRGKELKPYENEEFLSKLQIAYDQVGEVLNRRRKVILLVVDLAEADLDATADKIVTACAELNPETEQAEQDDSSMSS